MANGYEIVEVTLGDAMVLVLAQEGRPSFIEKLRNSGKGVDRASVIAKAMLRLSTYGTSWAMDIKHLRLLRREGDGLAVYELRANDKVIRVMTYVHDDRDKTPVYLFDFDGHQGKTGKVPRRQIERGVNLARAARECMHARECGEGRQDGEEG